MRADMTADSARAVDADFHVANAFVCQGKLLWFRKPATFGRFSYPKIVVIARSLGDEAIQLGTLNHGLLRLSLAMTERA